MLSDGRYSLLLNDVEQLIERASRAEDHTRVASHGEIDNQGPDGRTGWTTDNVTLPQASIGSLGTPRVSCDSALVMQGRTIAFWFLLLPLMLGAGSAQAQARTPHSASERRVHTWIRAGLDLNDPPAWDIGVTALGIGMIVVGTQLMDPPNGNIAPLDGAGHRAHHPTSDTVSDVLLYAGMPLMLLAAYGADTTSEDHGTHNSWVGALRVPVVVVEAWLLANGVTALIKNAGVCRPYAWQDDSSTCSQGSAELGSTHWTHSAFLSGHSANVASVAGSLFGMWVLPSRPQRALGVVTLVASALAVTMAALRVDAGAHSIMDVTSGFALGFGLGFGTAALHL